MVRSVVLSITFICVSILGFSQFRAMGNKTVSLSAEELSGRGDSCYVRGEMDKAWVCYEELVDRFKTDKLPETQRRVAHAYNRCGAISYYRSDYDKALNAFLNSISVCEEIGYEEYYPRVHNNIGNVYSVFGDYENAWTYYCKAWDESLRCSDKNLQISILNNLLGVSYNLKDEDRFCEYYNALAALDWSGNPVYEYYWLLSRAILELSKENPESALDYLNRSVEAVDNSSVHRDRNLYVSYIYLAKTYEKLGQITPMFRYLDKAKEIAWTNDYSDYMFDVAYLLSIAHQKYGDKAQAARYKDIHLRLRDSLFSVRSFGHLKDMQYHYDLGKKDGQIAEISEDKQKTDDRLHLHRQVLVVVSVALVLILILLIIMFRQYSRLKKSSLDLFSRNMEIMQIEEHERRLRQEGAAVEKKYQNSNLNEANKLNLQSRILKVMEESDEIYSSDFSQSRLAELVESNAKYVSQVINEMQGKSFTLFINEYRIREARKRLLDFDRYGHYTIAAISESIGFNSNAHFNAVFKKMTGLTPSAYRKMAAQQSRHEQEDEEQEQ